MASRIWRRFEITNALVPGVECCTACGSDLHTITGKRTEQTPTILGHEICGTVVRTGVTPLGDMDGLPLQPGDRVTSWTSVSCGDCDRCRGGLPQKCRALAKFGHESTAERWPLSGGLAEYVHLPVGTQVMRPSTDGNGARREPMNLPPPVRTSSSHPSLTSSLPLPNWTVVRPTGEISTDTPHPSLPRVDMP